MGHRVFGLELGITFPLTGRLDQHDRYPQCERSTFSTHPRAKMDCEIASPALRGRTVRIESLRAHPQILLNYPLQGELKQSMLARDRVGANVHGQVSGYQPATSVG